MSDQPQSLRAIDKPLFGVWQAFFRSFYDLRVYVDVAKRWKGFGLKYLLFMSLILTLPFALHICFQFNQYIKVNLFEPIAKLPQMIIQNGEISIAEAMPYVIKTKTGQVSIVIDTRKSIDDLKKTDPGAMMLISKSAIYFKPVTASFFFLNTASQSQSQSYVQTLDKHTNAVFDGQLWLKSLQLKRIQYIAWALIYPLIVSLIFSVYSVLFAVLAFMGQVVASTIYKTSISYKQAMRLLAVSSTPQTLLFIICLTENFIPPGLGFALIVLLSVYFSFAVIALKRESNQMVHR